MFEIELTEEEKRLGEVIAAAAITTTGFDLIKYAKAGNTKKVSECITKIKSIEKFYNVIKAAKKKKRKKYVSFPTSWGKVTFEARKRVKK